MTKSSHVIGQTQIDQFVRKDTKRKSSGRKKRSSGSRSSSDTREETLLIRHFVTQLIERACSIVMRDQRPQSQSDKSDQEQVFSDALEERKEPVQASVPDPIAEN